VCWTLCEGHPSDPVHYALTQLHKRLSNPDLASPGYRRVTGAEQVPLMHADPPCP
jgi:hypothetical protein